MTTLSELPFVTPADIAERAAEALAGGRGITRSLARFVGQIGDGYEPSVRRILAGEQGPDALRDLWTRSIDPSIGWESYARGAARTGEHRTFAAIEYGERRSLTLADAEAMVNWPIYRSAILADELRPILYGDGPDTQWSPDTLDAIGELVSPPARARRMAVKTTADGTAAAETALCDIHDTPTNRGTFGAASDTDVTGPWIDDTDNPELSCQVCGAVR